MSKKTYKANSTKRDLEPDQLSQNLVSEADASYMHFFLHHLILIVKFSEGSVALLIEFVCLGYSPSVSSITELSLIIIIHYYNYHWLSFNFAKCYSGVKSRIQSILKKKYLRPCCVGANLTA